MENTRRSLDMIRFYYWNLFLATLHMRPTGAMNRKNEKTYRGDLSTPASSNNQLGRLPPFAVRQKNN